MPVSGAYSYNIATERLAKPVGGTYDYVSRVSYIYLVDGVHKSDVDRDFGEAWGRTAREAREQMREIVEAWIAER